MKTTPKSSSKRVILYDNKHPKKIAANRLSADCRVDEAIVYLANKKDRHNIKERIEKLGIMDITTIETPQPMKCENCNKDISLFRISGKGIHTKVADSLPGGTGGRPHTSGEYYFPNFLSRIPHSGWEKSNHDKKWEPYKIKKETVTIAVLDTGIDKELVNPDFICDDFIHQKDAGPCFSEMKGGGWNFVNHNNDYSDDNKGRHGSLVSQYIINQFKDSDKGVKIMPLKTHDKNGESDLFSIICAIHFAMAKGANIINASWGFYYYCNDNRNFFNYFKELIGKELREKGILFVTAAGNSIPEDDILANDIYDSRYGVRLAANELRDLGRHKYFPAHLSHAESNIVTVTTTTTDGTGISPEQNYSNSDVDLGVKADVDRVVKAAAEPDTDPGFEVPFKLGSGTTHIAGSSFATAIASGVIGANCDKGLYNQHLSKAFLNGGPFMPLTSTGKPLFTIQSPLEKLIRNGTWISDYIKA